MSEEVMSITSVAEYLSVITEESTQPFPNTDFESEGVSSVTFFRGQANCEWGLSPSLYRRGLFDDERTMLETIRHFRPDVLSDDRFYDLTLLQHYGMPTRLLDLTSNPLVALYFACAGQPESDGKVFIFSHLPTSWSTDPLISLILDFCFDYHIRGVDIQNMLVACRNKYNDSMGRLMPRTVNELVNDLTIPAVAVRPRWSNERIMSQRGAFFLCGMEVERIEVSDNIGTRGKKYYYFQQLKDISKGIIKKNSSSIIVPSASKDTILDQLSLLGVDEMSLFPDLSHAIDAVIHRVEKNSIYRF